MKCLIIQIQDGQVKAAIPFNPNNTQEAYGHAWDYSRRWTGTIELLVRNDNDTWVLMDSRVVSNPGELNVSKGSVCS